MKETSLKAQDALIKIDQENNELPQFRIKHEGPLQFIVDASGRKVSKGYHDFEVFRYEEGSNQVAALLGIYGATKFVLKIPSEEGGEFKESSDRFHEIEYRPDLDGLLVTRAGAVDRKSVV